MMAQETKHPESVEALKANLAYAEALKEQAFHIHKQALINYAEAQTALNNALTRKYHGTAKKDS